MMFIRAISYLIISAFLTICVSAQGAQQGTSAVKWTRIEANDEVSVAVPEGFLVDREKSITGKTHRIFAWAGATSIEMLFRDETRFQGKITQGQPPEGVEVFKAEGLNGSRSCSAPGKRVSCKISLSSDRYSYYFTVDSLSEKPEIARIFLASIMVRGKAVFMGEPAPVSETRQLTQLITSPEITKALTRKPNDPVKVTQKRLSDHTGDREPPDTVLPAVILDKPFPGRMERISLSQPPNFGKKRTGSDIVVRGARATVTFLASGEIGEVVIYSDEKKSFIDDCIDAVKKIKFIPARENGKAVDSVQTVSYILNFL